MSGADDQRAAERLRDVVVCHCYEIAGPVGGGHWASCLAEEIGDEVTAVLVDRDRLRAELAETRAKRDQYLNALRTGTAMYEAAMRRLAETRVAGPTVGWVLHTSDADLMLHAQVVWQELRKRELTEPKTAEAREWADLHLRVVQALAETQAAGDALADGLDEIGGWDPEGIGGLISAWRSVRGDARTTPAADVRDPASETHRTSAAPAEHHVEAFVHDGGCQDWGWQCFTCGEEDCGYDSLAKAERGGDQHRVVALVESAAPADDTAAPGEPIEELREELAQRRSGIATAPPCTDGYWRNERHPPPPSATSGENADPREDT